MRDTELQYGIGIKQNLFNGMSEQRSHAQADKQLKTAQLQQHKEELLLKARVPQLVYKFLAANGLLTIGTLAETQANALYELSLRKEKAGLTSPKDRLHAETQLANASLQKAPLHNKVNAEEPDFNLRSYFKF